MIIDKLNDWIKRTVNENDKPQGQNPQPQTPQATAGAVNKGDGKNSHPNNRNKKRLFKKPSNNRDRQGVFHKSERNRPMHHKGRNSSGPNPRLEDKGYKAPAKKIPFIHPKVLRVIPIGGLNQVGQNMMIFEYEEDIIYSFRRIRRPAY